MKGKILGTSGDGGTISAEDGSRYKFTLMQWNSDRPPAVGQEVDFVSDAAGLATDVYPLKSGMAVDLGPTGEKVKELFGDGASSEVGARLARLATGNPSFQISIVILLASFFLTFGKFTEAFVGSVLVIPHLGQITAFNVSDFIDYFKSTCDAVVAQADRMKVTLGTLSSGVDVSGLFGNPDAIANTFRSLGAVTNILYLMYLAPLGAIVTIVQAVRGKPIGLPAFFTGIGCVAAFASLVIWRMVVASAIKSTGNIPAGQLASDAIHFGLGAYLILICGCVLLGSALGLIRLPHKS